MDPHLKYAGEAVFLIGVAFRLLRWVWGAVAEGDAPPSAYPVTPTTLGRAHPPGTAERIGTTPMADPTPTESPNAWYRTGLLDPPPLAGDPALFPPEMLAAMTPEQRTRVMQTLMKQRRSQS